MPVGKIIRTNIRVISRFTLLKKKGFYGISVASGKLFRMHFLVVQFEILNYVQEPSGKKVRESATLHLFLFLNVHQIHCVNIYRR